MTETTGYFYSDTTALVRRAISARMARWLAIAGFWTLVGILSASHWSVFPMGSYPYTWWELLRVKLALWYVWGLLTPVILHLGYRYRIERPFNLGRLVVLTILSLVLTLAYLVVYTQLVQMNITRSASTEGFGPMFTFVISRHSTFYFLAFWATIGLEHAVAYYQRYHERQLRASHLETMLAQAQLAAVRARLQPHFLFNALHSAVALIRVDRTMEATSMLTAISDLLRAALAHMDHNEVTLRDELALLRQYIAVEQIRFADRLCVTENIDPAALDALVPSFLLQPLMENAIRHGIESKVGRGEIALSGRLDNGLIRLEIADNGQGMTEDNRPVGSGTGLAATRERLTTMYADRFELELRPLAGGGAATVVVIPYTLA